MDGKLHRIDVHHHILPEEYLSAVRAFGVKDAGGIAFPPWSPEGTLAMMDRVGIATAITSVAHPGVWFGDPAKARSLARRCNEISARMVSDHPTRFGAFASVPLPDIDAALQELAYALDTLRLDGVVLLANIDGRYLGDRSFNPFFAELNRRKTVVFVHPAVPPGTDAIGLKLPAAVVEFTFDTTRAIANLIISGTLEHCPDVKMIFSHAGGTAPFLAGRLAAGSILPELRERAPQGAVAYLKRLYFDTAISANPYALESLRALVDPSHILFGSDHPFLPEEHIVGQTRGLQAYAGFDAAARQQVERDSALTLFPRLRKA